MFIIVEHETERGRDEAVEALAEVSPWDHNRAIMSSMDGVERMWTDKNERKHFVFDADAEVELVVNDVVDIVEADA